MKSSVGEKLDEKEIQWLSYLFGDSIANKMVKNWKVRHTRMKITLRKRIKIIVIYAGT
jgi:hypothetical protein